MYFGENAISRNLILCDKSRLLNPNAFVLGVPGSGKSFSTKELIAMLALSTDDDIVICDPEREYASLAEALGGEVVRIAAGSPHHINAMDMVEGYGEGGNPVADKSEFVLSLFEQLDRRGLGPQASRSWTAAPRRCTPTTCAAARRPRSPTCATNCSPSPSRRRATWRFRWSCSPRHAGRVRPPNQRGHPQQTPRLRHHGPRPSAQDHGAARHHRRDAQPRDGQLARGPGARTSS